MENNIKLILQAWKNAADWNDEKIGALKKKYNVKMLQCDEAWTQYKFKDTGIEFYAPHDECYEDYDLTGDALKFSEKHYDINEETFNRVDKELEEKGFMEEDYDEYIKWWIKDKVRYSVAHYSKKEEDIETEPQ